jgi:SET domain-containing protein
MQKQPLMKSTSKLHPKIRVIDQRGRKGLFAVAAIAAGEMLIDLRGEELLRAPTRESLQVGEHNHVVGRMGTVGCLNHACEPNARLAAEGDSIIALYDVAPAEEITVNYLATEYDMHEDFLCECGSPVCFGRIHGFRYLSAHERMRLLPLLAPYLRRRLRTVKAFAGAV